MVLLFRSPLDLLDDLGLSLWTPWLVYVHVREVTSWNTRVLGVLLLYCFVDKSELLLMSYLILERLSILVVDTKHLQR